MPSAWFFPDGRPDRRAPWESKGLQSRSLEGGTMSTTNLSTGTGWEAKFFSVTKFFAVVSAFITMLLMLYITADVFGRYGFNKPLPNSQAVAETLMVGLAFLGLAYVQAQKKNIYLDFLTNRLGPRGSALHDILSNVLSVLVIGLIVWASASWVWESIVIRDSMQGSFPIPYYYSKMPMFIGAVLLLVQFLIDLAKSIAGLSKLLRTAKERGN
jgi:TRAP-type C4-dicarboxylate transport system permease small subunit